MSLPETCWSMLCARWRWLEEDTVCSAVTWSEEFLFNVTGGLLLWSELEESILFRNNCHMEWLTFCVEKRSLNYLFFFLHCEFCFGCHTNRDHQKAPHRASFMTLCLDSEIPSCHGGTMVTIWYIALFSPLRD